MAQIVINISDDTYYRCKYKRIGLLPFDVPEVCYAIQNGKVLPKRATNGEMFKFVHSNAKVEEPTNCPWEYRIHVDDITFTVSKDWWDTPYKGGAT